MPIIALWSSIIFTVALFIIDNKYKNKTARALWIPFFFILIIASRPLALWLNPSLSSGVSEDASGGSPADLVFILFLIIFGVYILYKRKLDWAKIIKNNIWMFLLFLYCGISIIWSDVPRASFNAWVKVMVLPLMALIIVSEKDPLESIKTVIKRAAYVLIPLSIVLIKYYPLYGRTYSPFTGVPFYGGVTTYKNGLGVLCMIMGLFIVWDMINMLRNRSAAAWKIPLIINMLLVGMIIWLLFMANSATSLVGCIVGVSILIVLETPIVKSNIKYLNTLVFLLFFLSLFSFSFGVFEGFVNVLGRETTLTGRTVIWEKVLAMDFNPIIGTGYSSFWHGERGEFLLDLNWQKLTQAHNGYIETYINLGLIGLALLMMVLIKTYINGKNTLLTDFQYGKLQITYFVVFLLSNITEATFIIKSSPWFIFVLISLCFPKSGDNRASTGSVAI